MTVRPTPKHQAAARAARTPFAASLAAVLLALVLSAFPLLAAHAGESAKACPPGQVCQVPGISPAPVLPAPTPTGTATADPAPVIQNPAPAKPPVVTPAPVVQPPAPSTTPEEPTAASPASSDLPTAYSASPAASHWTPSASATIDSGWTKPIDDAKEATQAALVSDEPASGNGIFGILAIMAGVLVVGLGGLAFALWSRNRIGVH
jgi:hypothetical protein